MARKPNYDFEKRQKEAARKAKKDAKREERQARREERRISGEEGAPIEGLDDESSPDTERPSDT